MLRLYIFFLAFISLPIWGLNNPPFWRGIFEDHTGTKAPLTDHEKEQLSIYKGFILEGENLESFCKTTPPPIRYIDSWQRDQSIRSVMATVQFLGLDIVTWAIAKYAEYFRFTQSDYDNLVTNLTGNYCSKNITTISFKHLKSLMKERFKNNYFHLPKDKSYFPKSLQYLSPEEEYKKQEFRLTLELFKSLCSWGGDINDAKIMVPLLKNPVWMSFIGRQMNSQKLVWNKEKNNISFEKNEKTTKILCKNLICRKADGQELQRNFYRSVGLRSIRDDINHLYCDHFKTLNFHHHHPVPKIKDIIDKWNSDEISLINAQMISLVTGFPDFVVRSKTFNQAKTYIESSFEDYWNRWANFQKEQFEKYLVFEEYLSTELVDRILYFNEYKGDFSVEFDINMGEFDRIYQKTGKVTVNLNLKIARKSIHYFARSWIKALFQGSKQKNNILDKFEKRISKDIKDAKEGPFAFLLDKKLKKSVAQELLTQFALYGRNCSFPTRVQGILVIPIRFHISLFALKYFIDSKTLDNKPVKPFVKYRF